MKRYSFCTFLGFVLVLLGVPYTLVARELKQQRLNRQLITAVKQRHAHEALTLLAAGADGNARDLPPDHRTLLQRLSDMLRHRHPPSITSAPTALLLALTPPDDADSNDTGAIDPPRPEDVRLVRALLQHGAVVNVQNEDGETPLLLASQQGLFQTVRLLVDKGADLNAHDQYNFTPLAWAADHDSASTVRLLLDRGVDVNQPCGYGTALTSTASAEVVKLLLERGANIHARETRGKYEGDSALMSAIRCNNRKGAEILMGRGLDVNDGSDWGYTPLMFEAQYGNVDDLKFLLHRGAHLNATTEYGGTALMCACNDGIVENMSFLLAHGAKVNLHDNDGETALMTATQDGNDRAIKLLLDHGADVNARKKDGETALMVAAEDGNDSGAELLLAYGAKLNARDKSGKTALSYAQKMKEYEPDAIIDQTLREHGAIK